MVPIPLRALLVALLCSVGGVRAQEGPLRNDAYVAIDESAAAELARGDALLAALLAESGSAAGPDPTRLAAALEAWRAACEGAGPGATVPLDLARFQDLPSADRRDPGGEAARRTEAVPYGVLRRLTGQGPAVRAAWGERLGPLARERLAAAGRDPERLGALERGLPGTAGAARAALVRADQALEAGHGPEAANWLERAGAHATLAGDGEVLAALERRRALAAGLLSPPASSPAAALDGAGRLVPGPAQRLPQPRVRGARPGSAAVELGLAPLPGGGVAVVGPDLVWLRGGDRPSRSFEPTGLLRAHGLEPPPAGPRLGPRWPNLPRVSGPNLILTVGRAEPLTGRGNALLAVRPPEGVGLPALAWALGSFGHAVPETAGRPLAELLGEGLWEFQPGPLLLGDALYVQARRFALSAQTPDSAEVHQAEAWLLALEAAGGELRWARFLGQGVEVRPEAADRHGSTPPLRSPAEPVAQAGERIFVGTGLGLAALVEPADGRIAWTFLNRRRRAGEPGWRVGTPAPYDPGTRELFWAPGDGGHLYLLRALPDLEGQALLTAPPEPIGQAEELVAGRARRALLLSALGPRRALEERDLATGERLRSVLLRPDERFLGGALTSEGRVLVASDRGLYLFDRRADLRLLDLVPLELDATGGTGLVLAAGQVRLLGGGELIEVGLD